MKKIGFAILVVSFAVVAMPLSIRWARGLLHRNVAEVPREKVIDFCVKNFEKEKECLHDDAFWQIFSTFYLTAVGEHLKDAPPIDERYQARAVGIMKNDLLKMRSNQDYQRMCETMINHSEAPDRQTLARVEQARRQSCAQFANSFGQMIFIEGAFRNPKGT